MHSIRRSKKKLAPRRIKLFKSLARKIDADDAAAIRAGRKHGRLQRQWNFSFRSRSRMAQQLIAKFGTFQRVRGRMLHVAVVSARKYRSIGPVDPDSDFMTASRF